jgi:hypothetical protein
MLRELQRIARGRWVLAAHGIQEVTGSIPVGSTSGERSRPDHVFTPGEERAAAPRKEATRRSRGGVSLWGIPRSGG